MDTIEYLGLYLCAHLVEIVPPMLLALVLAGILGLERQLTGHAAGLRTHILVCLGATVMMLVTGILAPTEKARVTAGIITGIGFLGAGTIFNVGNVRTGLTTAAMIWFVAVLGIAIGSKTYLVAIIATAFALIIAHSFDFLERKLQISEHYVITIGLKNGIGAIPQIKSMLAEAHYNVTTSRIKLTEQGRKAEIRLELWGKGGTNIEELVSAVQTHFNEADNVTFER